MPRFLWGANLFVGVNQVVPVVDLHHTTAGAPKEHPTIIHPLDNLPCLLGHEIISIRTQASLAVRALSEGKSL